MSIHQTYDVLPIRRIVRGPGAISEIRQILSEARAERVMVVTTPSVARTRLMSDIVAVCGPRLPSVFSRTVAHNPAGVVFEAAAEARRVGVDTIVSLGGGTATDLGKAIKLVVARKIRSALDLGPLVVRRAWGASVPVRRPSPQAVPLHVVVPTTLSGAEFTHSCAITNEASLTKELFVYEELTPDVIVLDPAATLETPAGLWASTGIKAVDHAVEQIYALDATPLVSALCLKGLQLLYACLPLTVSDPSDQDARLNCLDAKWMIAFGMMNVGMGLSHGLGHQMGPRWGIAHGVTSCVTLPLALRFNRDCTVDQQCAMAEAIGLDAAATTREALAQAFRRTLSGFVRGMGLPSRLREVSGDPNDFGVIAHDVVRDPVAAKNPRPIRSEAEVVELLREGWAEDG